jgi:hypothetical protein
MRMRRSRLFVSLLTGLLAVVMIFAGCGKKDDPIPSQMKLPIVADLAVTSLPEGIILSWSLGVRTGDIGGFKILRSVTSRGDEACPGCPQEYRPFTEVMLTDERLRRDGTTGFGYTDPDVRDGSFYSYRIAVCNSARYCGEASNEAGMIRTVK